MLKINDSKKYLEREYLINKKTIYQIAKENNCVGSTILNKLRKYNIPIGTKNISFTKEFLEREYLVNKKSVAQIAKENNCNYSIMYNNLKKYNIPRRDSFECSKLNRKFNFTKQFLEQEFILNKKTISEIAKENNCCDATISSRLKEYNISIKNYKYFEIKKSYLKAQKPIKLLEFTVNKIVKAEKITKKGYIYILLCWNNKDDKIYYVGESSNFLNRISAHFNNFQRKKGSCISFKYKKKILIYLEILGLTTKYERLTREEEIKNMNNKEKQELINNMPLKILEIIKTINYFTLEN